MDNSPIEENHMIKKRRTFDAGFKLQMTRMILEQGVSVTQVCQDMKLSESAVRCWATQLQAKQSGQRGTGKPITALPTRYAFVN